MNTKTTLRANNQKASQDSRRGRSDALTPYPAREVPAAASKALCDQKIDSEAGSRIRKEIGSHGRR